MDSYMRAGFGDADTLRVTGNFLWGRHDELSIQDAKRGEQAQIEDRVRYFWLRADRNFRPGVSGTLWLGQASSTACAMASSISDPGRRVGARYPQLHVLGFARPAELGARRQAISSSLAVNSHMSSLLTTTTPRRRTPKTPLRSSGAAPPLIARRDLPRAGNRSSAFTSYRWRVTDRITAEAGLRAQFVVTESEDKWASMDPRLGLQWQLNPSTQLRINWGRFHQIDEIQELKVEDGLDTFHHPSSPSI